MLVSYKIKKHRASIKSECTHIEASTSVRYSLKTKHHVYLKMKIVKLQNNLNKNKYKLESLNHNK